MANIDISRNKTFSLKKTKSVFACELDFGDVLTSAGTYQLTKLPKEILITRASIMVITAFNSATSASGVLSVSGTSVKGASDLKSAANTVLDAGVLQSRFATGGILEFTPTYVGAPSAGKLSILVEYVEYAKNQQGELTSFAS